MRIVIEFKKGWVIFPFFVSICLSGLISDKIFHLELIFHTDTFSPFSDKFSDNFPESAIRLCNDTSFIQQLMQFVILLCLLLLCC